MAKNLLVINVDLRETRVALIEDGIIAELHLERASTRSSLGNIVLGKVTRVLPGMQAAFIDVGQERAAFLHVEDLIRPDDFEAYLTGGKRPDEEQAGPNEEDAEPREVGADTAPPESLMPINGVEDRASEPSAGDEVTDQNGDHEDDEEDEGDDGEDASDDTASDDAAADDAATDDAASDDVASDDAPDGDLAADAGEDASDSDEEADKAEGQEGEAHEGAQEAVSEALEIAGERVSVGELELAPVVPVSETAAAATSLESPTSPMPSARNQPPPRGDARQGGDRNDQRSFRSKRAARSRHRRGGQQRDGRDKKQGRDQGRGRNGQREPSRLSRSTPIREVVREGQEVIVQVSKEPIGTKGARVTSHVSLPGRYVVYMPTIDQIGISKRIGSDKERGRLREAIESIKPPTGGLIVRTVAEGLTKKQLKADVGYLVRLWEEVGKKRDMGGRAPTLLYQELDLVLKTARDLFTDDIQQIVIDDREQYQRLVRFVEMFMPERVKDIVLYSGDEPIFDAYGIEDEIGRALSRKVPLPSGGYLIIDQAEALTAIDVNTGRYVGKGSKDLEDTLFKTNLEAVEEIAYQLRFRNLGGLIVLDLIDMERASNREKIRRRLEELLQKDKAKTTLNRISDLGLIEMTRKRTRESLGRLLHEPCFYCDGTGQLQSKQTVVYEILRQIRRDRAFLPGYSVVVNAHPAVIDLMRGDEKESVQEAERRFMRRIELVPRREYHLEQFDLAGK
jgi:ribonuclease G